MSSRLDLAQNTVCTEDVRIQLQRIASLLDRNSLAVKVDKHKIATPPKRARSHHAPSHPSSGRVRNPYSREALLEDAALASTASRDRLKPVFGGTSITLETAIALRKVVSGTSVHPLTKEWKLAHFRYQFEETQYPYGIVAQRNGSRGLIMCIQGLVIKYLVFRLESKDEIFASGVLERPSTFEKTQALVRALAHVLWKAGGEKRALVCLPQDTPCFETFYQYRNDGVTEMLHLFEFNQYQELETFIKRYIMHFQTDKTSGCLLILYSVILSRTIEGIYKDYGSDELVLLGPREEVTFPLLNLLLTGKAVPHIHNGEIEYDEDGQVLEHPKIGIAERSDVGFLYWNKDEEDDERTMVGSMLKTPKKPIWVTLVNNQYGLLFSTNPELTWHWRSENRFTLHYYTGLTSQHSAVRLTVDTRYGRKIRKRTAKLRTLQEREEKRIPALELCIMSKWYGAEIDWNGTYPFF